MPSKAVLEELSKKSRNSKKRKRDYSAIGSQSDEEELSDTDHYDENGELLPCYRDDFVVADGEGDDAYVDEEYDYEKEKAVKKKLKMMKTLPPPLESSQESSEIIAPKSFKLPDIESFEVSQRKRRKPEPEIVTPRSSKPKVSSIDRNPIFIDDEPPLIIPMSQDNEVKSSPTSSAFRVQVIISGQKLVIPCKTGRLDSSGEVQTIGDLIRESVSRYSKRYGPIEINALKTLQGGELDSEDRIEDVLHGDQEVIALTADQDPNDARLNYVQRCRVKDVIPNPKVEEFLKKKEFRTFPFSYFNLKDEDGIPLLETIQDFIGISEFLLNQNSLGDGSVDVLKDFVQSQMNMKVLELSGNFFRVKSVPLLESISKIKTLTQLNLSLCTLEDKSGSSIEKILLQCSELKFLNVSNCQLSTFSLGKLANGLRENKSLEDLKMSSNMFPDYSDGNPVDISSFAHAVKISNLTSLDISACGINSKAMNHLGPILNSKLVILNLSDNSIGDEGAKSLAEHLGTSKFIQSLDLTSCNIKKDGLFHICSALRSSSSIASLSLGSNPIGDGIDFLLHLLEGRTTLKELYLPYCKISTAEANRLLSKLGDMEHCTLETLNIDCNQAEITDSSLILKLITESQLKKLQMSGNKISNSIQVKDCWMNPNSDAVCEIDNLFFVLGSNHT